MSENAILDTAESLASRIEETVGTGKVFIGAPQLSNVGSNTVSIFPFHFEVNRELRNELRLSAPPPTEEQPPPQEPPTQPPYEQAPPDGPLGRPPYGKSEEPPPELPPGRPPRDSYGQPDPPADKPPHGGSHDHSKPEK